MSLYSVSGSVTLYGVTISERVHFLSEKVFSYQWNVPEHLHEKAVNELRKMFNEKKVHAIDVLVYKWDISRIRNRRKALLHKRASFFMSQNA